MIKPPNPPGTVENKTDSIYISVKGDYRSGPGSGREIFKNRNRGRFLNC